MIYIIRTLLKILWALPLNEKKIFFSSYEGKQYSCNPKVIYESILNDKDFDEYTFVWELNDKSNWNLNKRTKYVEHNTLKYLIAVITSKYIVTNTGITGKIPLRKKQVQINTWHGGGAYKRVGYAINSSINMNSVGLMKSVNQTNYFLSSSRIFTEVMVESLRMDKNKFVGTGMPRNDIFFNSNLSKQVSEKVRNIYKINHDDILVLYAPTYRGNIGEDIVDYEQPDFEMISKALEQRYEKKCRFLIRMHYFNNSELSNEDYIPASDYPDMQELLVACDLLITDYSSSMWDFSLTNKPCILFMPDYSKYDETRGFYTPVKEWPGIVCFSNEEIKKAIEEYDHDIYRMRIEDYLLDCGSFDVGCATKQVKNLLK